MSTSPFEDAVRGVQMLGKPFDTERNADGAETLAAVEEEVEDLRRQLATVKAARDHLAGRLRLVQGACDLARQARDEARNALRMVLELKQEAGS